MAELVLREYDMRRDLEGMYDLAEAAYVEDYRRLGTSVKSGMERERRVVAVVSALGKLIPALRDITLGYVWDDNGKVVSFVHYARIGMTGDRWSIETVMTHPDYQRRGLARKLVEAALRSIRERGGSVCTLKVRADNGPAYELYRSLGFVHYDTTTHLRAEAQPVSASPDTPAEYAARRVSRAEWRRTWSSRYDLARRETPPKVQELVPISISEYKRPWFSPVLGSCLSRISAQRVERWRVERQGDLVATLSVDGDVTGKKTHEFELHVDPAHVDALALPLVDRALAALRDLPPCPILCEARASSEALAAALRARRFSEMSTWHCLGLQLDKA